MSRTLVTVTSTESADVTAEADEKLKAFIGSQRVAAQRPEDVSEQRMAIDSLHTEMIHLQEEKNLVAMQVCATCFQYDLLDDIPRILDASPVSLRCFGYQAAHW